MRRTEPTRWSDIALVLLAAGRSTRFGMNKLAADLGGMSLLHRTADIYACLPFSMKVIVTTRSENLPRGFAAVLIEQGLPQSASLVAGVDAAMTVAPRGLLLALADMPLVTASHLGALLHHFDASVPVCSLFGGIRSPPVLFPATMGAALRSSGGDQGARDLLVGAQGVPAEAGELFDIDTAQDLAHAKRLLQLRDVRPRTL